MQRKQTNVERPAKAPRHVKVTMLFPSDILAWLKAPGRGYQARLNKMLRAIMENTSIKA